MRVSGVARIETTLKLIIEEVPSTFANVPSPARRERVRVRARGGKGAVVPYPRDPISSKRQPLRLLTSPLPLSGRGLG